MIDAAAIAAKHPIERRMPSPDFFQGALLGNGGLGAVVTTRPDAVLIHFGHNHVWDIRLAENNRESIGTFQEIFEKVQAIGHHYESLQEDPWFRDYLFKMRENYGKPYPSPMPCGSVLFGFDRRHVEVLGHRVDISTGLCEVELLVRNERRIVQIVLEPELDRLWLRSTDLNGEWVPSPFDRMKLIPDPDRSRDIPMPELMPAANQSLSFRQVLPYGENWAEKRRKERDKAFRLSVRLADSVPFGDIVYTAAGNAEGIKDPIKLAHSQEISIEARIRDHDKFMACIQLDEGYADRLSPIVPELPSPNEANYEDAVKKTAQQLADYWRKSGVSLEDPLLERIWYWNLYFLNCSVKAGAQCPGLFANWSYKSIGTAWHGDYHMNYNTQQPFWVTFSSNHIDKHLPYVDMIDHLLPVSKQWAREYYKLRGACFPHSAYPVEMTMMPYPLPTWGWEICETPWSVQSLWWHYLYTMDEQFLRDRAFGPMREAVLFLVDYMNRPEASGDRWGDGKLHIFPTVSPELYGLRPGFDKNADCIVDLALTKFVFQAFLQACEVLKIQEENDHLLSDIRDALLRFPNYPVTESRQGKVFVSVPGEDPEIVYNTPNSLATVFPGEDHGLHSDEETYHLACTTYRNLRTEGGNELVFHNLQAARLGILDLERFKRQIEYCLLPNGTCTDLLLQTGGRYYDTGPFDFMARMGIWFENFALPAVINECLLQSYNGVIRLFCNWPQGKRASFHTLRAVGGFLVSAAFDGERVEWIEVISEAGSRLQIYNPWDGSLIGIREKERQRVSGRLIELETGKGETLRLVREDTYHDAKC
ncbi:glycosyl hydrolase family 95 catalytic domain-containing protein [Paenibacillus arenilitoris]|nr:hypothetical protein [Paenibacillus arenilitoris]